MDQTPALAGLHRDEAAARFIQEVNAAGRQSQLHPILRRLPLLLRQHGLGQTLAYLQSRAAERAGSPYQQLYASLSAWLRQRLALPGSDLLATLTQGDSQVYLLAAEEASAFVLALRRAAAAAETAAMPPDIAPQEAS